MYKIIVRNQEPIFVEEEQGKFLFNAWTEKDGAKPLPAKISIRNIAFYSSDIRGISKIIKGEAESAPKENDDEYLSFRKKMLSLSIEKRAEIMRIPIMVWKSHSTDEMPEKIKEEIKKRQLIYLTENPNCMYANPKIYRDLIPKPIMRKQIDTLNPITNIASSALMRLLKDIIQTDLQYSLK